MQYFCVMVHRHFLLWFSALDILTMTFDKCGCSLLVSTLRSCYLVTLTSFLLHVFAHVFIIAIHSGWKDTEVVLFVAVVFYYFFLLFICKKILYYLWRTLSTFTKKIQGISILYYPNLSQVPFHWLSTLCVNCGFSFGVH